MIDPMQRTDGIALETKDHTANEKFFKTARTISGCLKSNYVDRGTVECAIGGSHLNLILLSCRAGRARRRLCRLGDREVWLRSLALP
jgi:hypothetical protein